MILDPENKLLNNRLKKINSFFPRIMARILLIRLILLKKNDFYIILISLKYHFLFYKLFLL
jgi:hypothetical protein